MDSPTEHCLKTWAGKLSSSLLRVVWLWSVIMPYLLSPNHIVSGILEASRAVCNHEYGCWYFYHFYVAVNSIQSFLMILASRRCVRHLSSFSFPLKPNFAFSSCFICLLDPPISLFPCIFFFYQLLQVDGSGFVRLVFVQLINILVSYCQVNLSSTPLRS